MATYRILIDLGTDTNAVTYQVDSIREGVNDIRVALTKTLGAGRYGVILNEKGRLKRRYVLNRRGTVDRAE